MNGKSYRIPRARCADKDAGQGFPGSKEGEKAVASLKYGETETA